jgi:hypothetical protein
LLWKLGFLVFGLILEPNGDDGATPRCAVAGPHRPPASLPLPTALAVHARQKVTLAPTLKVRPGCVCSSSGLLIATDAKLGGTVKVVGIGQLK